MNAAVVLAAGAGFATSALFLLKQSSTEHRHLRPRVTPMVGVLSGALAMASTRGGSTAWMISDSILIGVFAAITAGATVRAKRNPLLFCTFALAFVSFFGTATDASNALAIAALSGIPLGAAVAMRIYPQRERFLQAAIAPLVALSLLHLPTSLPQRLPSAVAGLVAVVLVSSAYGATTKRNRRTIRSTGIVFFAVAGLAVIAGVLALFNARPYAERAVSGARSGLVAAEDLKTDLVVGELDGARRNLDRARKSIRAPWAFPARAVPILGRNLAAVDDLTSSVGRLTRVSKRVVNTLDLDRFRPVNGAIDTKALVRLRSDVDAIQSPLSKSISTQRRIVNDPWIVSPLVRRLESFAPQLQKLDGDLSSLDSALTFLPRLLGGDGPRRYLLAVVTPAEARGSGGVLGNFGEITAVDGKLSLTRFGRSAELTTNGIAVERRLLDAPADFIERYSVFGASIIWSNINMGPDFRAVGMAMANHYPQSGGSKVDGVISVDPIALEALLRVLGPINVAGWPEPLDGKNTAEVLLFRSYVDKGGSDPARLELLSQVAQTVWTKITDTKLAGPRILGKELGPAARMRHFQVWMRDPAEQSYVSSLHLSGAVPENTNDNFGFVVNNASGNKIEWFLHRSIRYESVVDFSSGKVKSVAIVTLRNDSPKQGLPDYIIGNSVSDITVARGDSRLYVSMYSPLKVTGAKIGGAKLPVTRQTELGRNVFSSWIIVPSGKEITLEYELAGEVPLAGATYKVDFWSQPLVRPDDVAISVRSAQGEPAVLRAADTTGELKGSEFEFKLASTTAISAEMAPE